MNSPSATLGKPIFYNMLSPVFQDKTNNDTGNGPTVNINNIGTKRTRQSFKVAHEDNCSKSNSLTMDNSITEPRAKRSKRLSSATPNENTIPIVADALVKEVIHNEINEIVDQQTIKVETKDQSMGKRSLRSTKQGEAKKVSSTVTEEETSSLFKTVEVKLDKEFWKKSGANNEQYWEDVMNDTKISLMRMEFPNVLDQSTAKDHSLQPTSSANPPEIDKIIVLSERSYMKNRKKHTEYWVKIEGKSLNDQCWYTQDIIGDIPVAKYKKREKVIELFEKVMRKKKGDTGFPRSYPHSNKRKIYLDGESAKWRLRLREIEEHWNNMLASTGQAPIYIEDWTGYENSARFKIGTRPASFLKTNRRVLNFEYLVQNMVPQDLANELFDYEQKHVEDASYSCNCEGICGNCACERFSFVKIRKGHVDFREENNPLYTPCGILCNCAPNCNRRLLIQGGRQYPLILFYTGKRGWGVFSAGRLRVGSFLGIYTGELKRPSNLGNTSYQFRIPTILKENPQNPDEQEKELCLESACSANELSLVNHSCENGNIRSFHIANKNRFNLHDIGFVVTKTVEPGDELLYNYFKGSGKGNKDICWCTPYCRNKHFAAK